MIYFSSDHHFNHVNILNHCNRPFSSVEDMDKEMVDRWNSVVKENDEIYYLGDLTLGNWETAYGYIKQLKGRIKFIKGNHDERWFPSLNTHQKLPPIHEFKLNKKLFVLCHYSMQTWNGFYKGSIHLFGHSHGNLEGIGKSMDVGVDSNNFYPISIDEVLEKMNE